MESRAVNPNSIGYVVKNCIHYCLCAEQPWVVVIYAPLLRLSMDAISKSISKDHKPLCDQQVLLDRLYDERQNSKNAGFL